MDSTKMIADLCAVIDRMNVIIQAQAMELAQFGAVVHAEEIAEAVSYTHLTLPTILRV